MTLPGEPPAFHPVRYWRQEHAGGPQNFGDFLSELFLAEMLVVPSWPADAYYLVGSVIREQRIRRTLAEHHVDPTTGRVAFWGCGLRSAEGLSAAAAEAVACFGVRGPLTRDALGLPTDTVLGDPGLLLPLLVDPPPHRHGRTLCITHFHEPRPADDLARETGVDEVVSAAIPPSLDAVRSLVGLIAGAGFVLCGSLHAAITACGYGVPFAFLDSGHIDVPFKWEDFAASVGIPCHFARTLAEGRAIHGDAIAPAYRPLPLSPLLHVAPFHVLPDVLLRGLAHDGLADAGDIAAARVQLAPAVRASRRAGREAQRRWLEIERARFADRRLRHSTGKPSDAT
jgi:hypothetical protein